MSTTFGDIVGNIIPQTGFSPRQDTNGGWSATREYRMLRSLFDVNTIGTFSRGVSITTFDDTVESYWGFLKIESKDVVYEEADHVVVRITFTGSPSPQFSDDTISEEALPTYSLNGSLAEVSFSEHPKFKALTDYERNTLGKLMAGQVERIYDEFASPPAWVIIYPRTGEGTGNQIPAQEQLTSADALSFAELIAEGQTTYLRPTFTWTETTHGNTGLNTAQINSLGRIVVPRGGPPEPGGGRDWMLTNATQEQRGELFQTRLEWTLSERGGHNEFLYSE